MRVVLNASGEKMLSDLEFRRKLRLLERSSVVDWELVDDLGMMAQVAHLASGGARSSGANQTGSRRRSVTPIARTTPNHNRPDSRSLFLGKDRESGR